MPNRLAAFLLSLLAAGAAFGHADGSALTQSTWRDSTVEGTSCGQCHGSRPGFGNIVVTLTGPTTLYPGQTGTFTVAVTGGTPGDYTGVVVSTTDFGPNPLSASAPLQPGANGTLVHVSAPSIPFPPGSSLTQVSAGGTASYSFSYTLPAGAGLGSTRRLHAVVRTGIGGGTEGRWDHANLSGGIPQGLDITAVAAPPTAPDTLDVTARTPNTATLAWTGGGPQVRLVYRTGTTPPADANDGTATNFTSGETSTTVFGLNAGPDYAFRIFGRSNDGSLHAAGPAATAILPPEVTGPGGTAFGTVGTPLPGLTITATNLPTSYAGTSLPPGVGVNPATGLVAGTPTARGTYNATLSASNAGGSGSIARSFVIAGLAQSITFGAAPTPNFSPGGTFAVSATSNAGLPLTFSAAGSCTLQASGPASATLAMTAAGFCTVTASQATGNAQYEPAPQASQLVSIAVVPADPPIVLGVDPGDGSVRIHLAPPAFTGGSAITGYSVACFPGPRFVEGATSPLTLTGLPNGTPHACQAFSLNAVGGGPPSDTFHFTPKADGDGMLDPAFGTGGNTVNVFGGIGFSAASSLAVDGQMRLIVGGQTNGGGAPVLAVTRFLPDGALDSAFGTNGVATVPAAGLQSRIEGVAAMPDGRILFAGISDRTANTGTFIVGRLLANGAPDPTFGTGGFLKLPALSTGRGAARAIAYDAANGGAWVAGDSAVAAQPLVALLVRLDAAGTPIRTISTPLGIVIGSNPPIGFVSTVAMDPAGRAVASGSVLGAPSRIDLAVLRADGNGLDATFGSGGIVVRTVPGQQSSIALSLAIDAQGRPNLAGRADRANGTDFLLVRLSANGAVESEIVADQGTGGFDNGSYLVIDGAGRRILAGSRELGGQEDYVISRYLDNGSLDATLGGTGRVSTGNPVKTEFLGAIKLQRPGTVVALAYTVDGTRLVRFVLDAPLPFAFSPAAVTAITTGTLAQSNAVALQSLANETYVKVTNGEWSRNCSPATFTTADGFVLPGESVCVRHVTAGTIGQSTTTTLVVGGRTTTFTTTPNAINTGPSANLSVTQSATPAVASTGKDIVYTLTASNAGPAAATNVTLTSTLPGGTAFVWAFPGCVHNAGVVTCPIGTLGAGQSAERKVVARPAAAGPITHNASVAASEPDNDLANNASGLTVTVNASPAGAAVQRYRLFSPVTLEHLYTTDLNEYNTLGSFVGTWVQEGTIGKVYDNPGFFNGVAATPYYRLYNTSNLQHHWTTDANEYYTLILFPQYNAEGVDGYIFPTQATGTIPLYRLLYPFTVPVAGLHHWTIDANEYNTLIASFGWVGEGGSGFVIP